MASLVQEYGQGRPLQPKLTCPVQRVMTGHAKGGPREYSNWIPYHESRNGQGQTSGHEGVDQQVVATFFLPKRRFRRLEGEVTSKVQKGRHNRRVGEVACQKHNRQGHQPRGP